MIGGAGDGLNAFSSAMPKKQKPNSPPIDDQARRLRTLREAHGYPTSNGFAGFLGIGANRYNNFENGVPLSREVVFLLVQSIPGLTSDWLYFGKPDGLPVELARRLGELGPPGKRNTA
jgi:transcriptional regulator with XRE-family HTH domain